jgi:type IV pilus assembly protein PilN
MIRINLLPHRQAAREQRKREFFMLLGLAALAGAAIWYAGSTYLDSKIANQTARNQLLKDETAKIDKQIEEIKKLKEQTQALLARKQVVEGLQTNRAEVVRILDQVVRQMPDGVYVKAIKQTGERLNIAGYAQSNSRVSNFMRNLETSTAMSSPELIEVKAVDVNKQRVNEFAINVKVKSPQLLVDNTKAPLTAAGGLPKTDADRAREALVNKMIQ